MEEEVKRLFIHIPKNGGTSVHKENDDMVMDILSFDHERWRDVPRDIRYIYKSFAVTRNPWARTISRYEMGIPTHFVSPLPTWAHKPNSDRYGVTFNSFEEFLETRHIWVNEWFDPIRSWNTQYDYVCDENEMVRCDILRLEHIDEELIPYLQLYSTNVVKENVGEYTKDYKDYYNEQTIQIVADWYAQDIDYWGFDFDTSATKNYHYEKEI